MKTILYNTQTNELVGGIREGSYNGIWDSAMSQISGWFPAYISELTVVETEEPEYDNITQYLTDEWIIEDDEYKRVWTIHDKPVSQIVIEVNNWQHSDKNIRILVPNLLATQYPQIFALWQMRKLPIEAAENDKSYLYCSEIEQNFKESVVDPLVAAQAIIVQDLQELINNYV